MSLRPRPEVRELAVCHHGGINHAELQARGIGPEQVLDFSVCTNPFPPPAGIKKAIRSAAISQYPDSEATELRQCLSDKLGVSTANLLVGSGTTELIRLIALAYFGKGDTVLVIKPTYGEYEIACRIAGASLLSYRLLAGENFTPDINELVRFTGENRPGVAFICNPNNPTGTYLSYEDVRTILSASRDTLFVLDEAYVNFIDRKWLSTDLTKLDNVIILRSMTKDYAIAGLRLGYAVASETIINALRRVCPPWNVNIMAQRAGIAALRDDGYLERSRQKVRKSATYLKKELSRLGFRPLPSVANFFLVKVGDAAKFRATLLKYGILVRDCTSFGLPEYVRLAPRTLPECRKFIDTLEELKKRGQI